MFRARLPSIFITCYKMARLPRNLHLVTTLRSADCDSRKTTALHVYSVAPATKNATHLLKTWQKYCACHTNDWWHVLKHVAMSRSATPATRNEAMRLWRPPKVAPFAELTIGTAIRPSRERLRTVADGCGRLRTVADGCGRLGNVWRTQLNPRPPEWNGTLATHSGKTQRVNSWLNPWSLQQSIYIYIYIYVNMYIYICI